MANLVPKGVSTGRGKESENLAPRQENEPGADDEGPRTGAGRAQEPIADAAQGKGDRHRVFAADHVRHPTEQRPRRPVHHIIDEERQSERRRPERLVDNSNSLHS